MKPTWCTIFLSMLISFHYMFWATMCPSSGEITLSLRHFVLVILCGCLSGMPGMHTRQSSTKSDKYQVSHRYSCFFWCWAHSHPKHVEIRNKHTKKNCAPSWVYLQDYTRMHRQQNIKNCGIPCVGSGVGPTLRMGAAEKRRFSAHMIFLLPSP